MTESELFGLLQTTGLEVAYDHFVNKIVAPPFILYRNDESQSFFADNKTFILTKHYIVDLVTDFKDPATELIIEQLFDDNEIPFEKMEDYIASEKIFQIRYFI